MALRLGERVAVVTGGNRGIGYATVRRLCEVFNGTIIFTSRNHAKGMSASQRLGRSRCYPNYYQLDNTDSNSTLAFRDFLNTTYGGLDVLVNNVGTRLPGGLPFVAQVRNTLHVNFYATYFLCVSMFQIMRPHARVVNLSSPCGHLSDVSSERLRQQISRDDLTVAMVFDFLKSYKERFKPTGKGEKEVRGGDPYCMSKVAVTALTIALQNEAHERRRGEDIVYNSYSPGNVRSRVTDYVGTLKPSDVAKNIVKLAMLRKNVTTPVGKFVWHDLKVVSWKGRKPVN